MKPLSTHWADITAMKIIKSRGDKQRYVLASGITPSGLVHVGNFREVITVDLVARALRSLGKEVEFLYSWDNFDTFRKVPKNVPNPQEFEQYLRQPISRIPDPWQEAASYAEGRMKIFEAELKNVGIFPAYRYQEKLYSKGTYADAVRFILENVQKIRVILNAHKTSPLSEEWLPTSIYCGQCHRDEMKSQTYDGGWSYSYHCAGCDHRETVDIRHADSLKLAWRVDWPMRWHHEGVDFEPGGKDHSSQGGSFDTGKEIIKELWGEEAPMYLQYDFVMIKGGTGKMSSSSGQLYTLSEVLEVYDPQIVRWIFANHRPNHDFSLSFDEDVIRAYDEFDRSEASAFGPKPEKAGKWEAAKRAYEFSLVDGFLDQNDKPRAKPLRAGFRVLCNRLQICGGDVARTFERYYSAEMVTSDDKDRFFARAQCAWTWLTKFASDEYRYTLHPVRISQELDANEKVILERLKKIVSETDLESIEPKELNDLIWQQLIHETGLEPKHVFRIIYQQLIGRDQGPRLPSFLKEVGRERLIELV